MEGQAGEQRPLGDCNSLIKPFTSYKALSLLPLSIALGTGLLCIAGAVGPSIYSLGHPTQGFIAFLHLA